MKKKTGIIDLTNYNKRVEILKVRISIAELTKEEIVKKFEMIVNDSLICENLETKINRVIKKVKKVYPLEGDLFKDNNIFRIEGMETTIREILK